MGSWLSRRLFALILLPLLAAPLATSPAAASGRDADNLAGIASGFLFELDQAGLERALRPYLQDKPAIQSVRIVDALDQSLFWTYQRGADNAATPPPDEKEPESDPSPPRDCAQHQNRVDAEIRYDGDVIGALTLCLEPEPGQVLLTPEERAWIDTHPSILVSNERNWAPFNFVQGGRPSGFSIDYVKLLAEKIGLRIEFVTGEWGELLNRAMNKKLDVMVNIARTDSREPFFLFTDAYAVDPSAIVTRENAQDINGLRSLEGRKVALMEGDVLSDRLKQDYPLIHQVLFPSAADALKAVAFGQVDATIGSRLVLKYNAETLQLQGLDFSNEIADSRIRDIALRLGVRKDYPVLHGLFTKAIAAVTAAEMTDIRRRWTLYEAPSLTNKLTPEQRAWIAANPVVKVGGELDWAPFDFVNDSGEYDGMARDFLDLIATMTGLEFQVETGRTWNELLEALKQEEIDLLPAIYFSEERDAFAHFTTAYLSLADYFFTREGAPKITAMEQLHGKPVAVVKGYAVVDWMKQRHPEVPLVETKTVLDAVRLVSSGEVAALINDNPSTTYAMRQYFIANVVVNNLVPERNPIQVHMATNNSQPILAELLSLAIKHIPQADRRAISNRWMASIKGGAGAVDLTAKEREWLTKHRTLRFAVDPDWLPIEGINPDTKRYEGMMSDVLDTISDLSGLKFQLVPTDSWRDSLALIETGQVDMLTAVSKTPERQEFLDFTSKTLALNDGVLMPGDAPFISSLNDLIGLRVGVSEGTSVHKMLERDYPELILVRFKSTAAALRELNAGNIDALVDNLEVLGYLINQQGLYNLKVVLRLEQKRYLHIALRKEIAPEARSIINKAIGMISEEDLNAIRQRWVALKVTEGLDYQLLWKIALAIAVLIAFITYNNYRLNKLVRRKTADIERQKEELRVFNQNLERMVEERTRELTESEARIRELHELTRDSINYASLIQSALLPEPEIMGEHIDEHFCLWQPKDVVGGDIYLFEPLRHPDESLLFVIDCTGHGVPGAFVTMLVKAIERQLVTRIINGNDPVSPAKILSFFNRNMKHLLKQESPDAASNAGFDGGVLYIDRRAGVARYAGAETPLFCIKSETKDGISDGIRDGVRDAVRDEIKTGRVKTIKGDRHSVGYRVSDANYGFKDHEIPLEGDMRFYLTTDGYLDQLGGSKGFPFGKRRFKDALAACWQLPMDQQKAYLLAELAAYRGHHPQVDDMTMVGLRLKAPAAA